MGGSAGGELAAAVSAGGGLGLVGGGRGERDWCERELAIVAQTGDDTERSRVLDIARGAPWPRQYTARTLRNVFLERWRGREDELADDDAARRAYAEAASTGDLAVIPVWGREAIDLIRDVPSATDLVPAIVAEAEAARDHASTRR
jgi:nitronate monooxygenase